MYYECRFISNEDKDELLALWRLSKVHSHSRHERLCWTKDNFCKKHPEYKSTAVYKDLDGLTY